MAAVQGTFRWQLGVVGSVFIPVLAGLAFALIGIFAGHTWHTKSTGNAEILFDYIIPGGAGIAFMMAAILLARHAMYVFDVRCRHPSAPRFGRKGLIMSTGSFLIITSCFYRSIFIASEGAAMCRGNPSAFNAPVAGRSIATIGEIALVVQIAAYISSSSERLGASGWVWANHAGFAYIPVVLAECLSWTGVLSGNARFFCCEYFVWCLIALTWVWDGAELLHKVRGGSSCCLLGEGGICKVQCRRAAHLQCPAILQVYHTKATTTWLVGLHPWGVIKL